MNFKAKNKKSETGYTKFIEYIKGLSALEVVLEASSLIERTFLVDVDKAYDRVKRRIAFIEKKQIFLTTITRIAAVLTLPLLAFSIWSLLLILKSNPDYDVTWQEIHSPVGIRSHLVLPDGTNLWLNAGSKIRYRIPFVREAREIELSGEAFLDVESDGKSPFLVHTKSSFVEVLGTQFNVKAYPESEKIEVALKEGKIKFHYLDQDGTSRFSELNSNNFLEFNTSNKTLASKNANIEKYVAWHQNILLFDETPMEEVVQMLEQWYGVKVIIDSDEIKKYRFTTTFDNEPLFRVLELLEFSSPGISMRYTPGKPAFGTQKPQQSVVNITVKKMPMYKE